MKKKEYSKKKKVRLFYMIGLICITTPILLFIAFFKDYPVSHSQSDWANFGTYFNGILTPIISIFSFVILIYIYFEIEKLSNENNHNLYVLQLRMKAYEELQLKTQNFSQLSIRMKQILNQAKSSLFKDKLKLNESTLFEIREVTNTCTDFYNYLENFPLRYNHIFKKNIESDTYEKLLNDIYILHSQMLTFYSELLSRNKDKYEKGKQPFYNYDDILNELNQFSKVLNSVLIK